MSPEPYVRGQAFAFAVSLVVAAVLGPPWAAFACAALGAVVARGLYGKYRGDMRAATRDVPPHRERLDLIMAGDARAAIAVGLTASTICLAFDVQSPAVGISPTTPPLLAFACAAVYLSSLVDWYLILPRITGQLGARPCRPGSGDHPRFPKTWRETTRWWHIHRIASALLLSFALLAAIVATADDYISIPRGGNIVAAVLLGGLVAYRRAAMRAFMDAGHPTMIVGSTVRRRNTVRRPLLDVRWRGRRLRIPGFKRKPVGPLRQREYIVDVALEAVQLVPARKREGEVPRDDEGRIVYVRHPKKIALKDVGAVEPADDPFRGCERRCSGINWYCIENPSCFEPK